MRRGNLVYVLVVLAFLALLSRNSWFTTTSENSQNHDSAGVNYYAEPEEPSLHRNSVTKETTLLGSHQAHGFTLMDRLYVWNGTFYIVTSDPSKFPPRDNIIARPFDKGKGYDLEPTDEDLQFITPEKAKAMLGDYVMPIDGMSMFLTDTDQFFDHYYHWWGEIILGSWRVYTAIAQSMGLTPSSLPPPTRFVLPHVEGPDWRDHAGVNAPMMRATFPSASIQQAEYWRDLIKLNTTVVFECAMIINRAAAHRSPYSSIWYKMIAGTMNVTAPDMYWEPIRKRTTRNMLGFLPELNDRGVVVAPPQVATSLPVVTYVSRQGGGRRLLNESHDGLVAALKQLESENICEVHVALMETMDVKKQLELVAKSTIMIGVHGNGLTHQLWMPSSPRSTVFEIMYPPAYVYDYEMLARNMGHVHYAVWNDTLKTYPKGTTHKGISYGDSSKFHGNSIYVHGPAVADTVRQRLLDPI